MRRFLCIPSVHMPRYVYGGGGTTASMLIRKAPSRSLLPPTVANRVSLRSQIRHCTQAWATGGVLGEVIGPVRLRPVHTQRVHSYLFIHSLSIPCLILLFSCTACLQTHVLKSLLSSSSCTGVNLTMSRPCSSGQANGQVMRPWIMSSKWPHDLCASSGASSKTNRPSRT